MAKPMNKREAVKAMFEAVEAGNVFTLTNPKGTPLAMVIPWDSWLEFQNRLSDLGKSEHQRPTSSWPQPEGLTTSDTVESQAATAREVLREEEQSPTGPPPEHSP